MAAWNRQTAALRTGLPEGIQIVSVRKVDADFHARFSAIGKRYIYTWYEGAPNPFISRFVAPTGHHRLDVVAMHSAAQAMIGTHDFSAFAASRGDGTDEDPVKTLYKVDIKRRGRTIRLVTEGSGYLYKMVRSMAGALQDVGRGRLRVEQIAEILESRQRTSLVVTALARGLTLEKVFYGKELKEKK
jgi:tRNA pseudouridine38-40 synthase